MAQKLMTLEKRVKALEIDVAQIRSKLKKAVKRRRLRLKEKFIIHDIMKDAEREFALAMEKFDYKGVRSAFKAVCILVDRTLGVEYP